MVPVSANVEKRAQVVALVAHEDHRHTGNLAREVIAGLGERRDAADVLPGTAEDLPALEFEDAAVAVPRGRKCAAGANVVRNKFKSTAVVSMCAT